MQSPNENQWQWLKVYGGIARWSGWMLVIFSVLGLVGFIYGFFERWVRSNQPFSVTMNQLQFIWANLRTALMPGIMALGIAQFLRWLTDQESQPGLLLRHGPKLLIISAAIYLSQVVLMLWQLPGVIRTFTRNLTPIIPMGLIIVSDFLVTLAPVIILFGLAEALRRIGPIVGESKEMV